MSTPPPASEQPSPIAIAAEQDALPPGTRFGELELLRVLGVGGFGIVYLARDHSLERDVALKEYMPAALAVRGQGPQITVRSGALSETYAVGLRSFINEARLLAKFDHPSLVKVYRFWEDNATAYMVMPYLQGRTLREARRAMPTSPDEAWLRSVIDPILGAIEVLHRDGVFHRDIAPDNILLPPEGPPVLLDFGAARRVISDRTQSLTAILKPNYAPIEQYAEMTTLRQGPWTDLYALGAVLHFLLAGAPPVPATARAVQDEMQPLWTRNFPGVSQRFLAAVDWALAVRPQDRPQSVEALRAVLDGRTEPPVFARTVPGSTSLMPVGEPRAGAGFEPTQAATAPAGPAYQTTVREPAPGAPVVPAAPATQARTAAGVPQAPVAMAAAMPTGAPAAPPRRSPDPAPSRVEPAVAGASSRKGLVGAALAIVAVLAAAAGWQIMESRGTSTAAVAQAASAPVAPVAAAASAPVVAPVPVAVQEAPAAVPAPAASAVEPAPPVVAETAPPAPAASEPAATPPVAATTPAPEPTVLPSPRVAAPARPVAPTHAAAHAVPPVRSTAVPSDAARAAPEAAPAEAPVADTRPYNPIPTAGAAEPTRAERARLLREALREQRQARQESAPPAYTANVPLGAPMPGSQRLGAPMPGDVPLGAAPTGPATAREACGGRVLVALWTCLQRECRKPRYAQQAECVKISEELRARDLQ